MEKTKKRRRFINITYISLTLILVILYFVPSPGRNLFADFSGFLSSLKPNISGGQSDNTAPFTYLVDSETKYCQITGVGSYSDPELQIPQRIDRYTVTSIGSSAFLRQSSFRTLRVHGLVEFIGANAFAECRGLESVILENGIMHMDNYTFYGCDSLMTVTIPISVNYIGAGTFLGCRSLTDIYYDGSMEKWNLISTFSDWDSNKSCTVHCNDGDIFAGDVNSNGTIDENGDIFIDENGDGIIDENDITVKE
ncbi:MAG: leucine-rich repeat domain-containing protein [Clostridia bacterium]|nr:leucine-rich repeat domain-containing protein [Clostridia bacterium]